MNELPMHESEEFAQKELVLLGDVADKVGELFDAFDRFVSLHKHCGCGECVQTTSTGSLQLTAISRVVCECLEKLGLPVDKLTQFRTL